MVQDTVMPDHGGGGSPSTAAHSAPGRGMTCSYAGCTSPTPGIPFCMTHLSLLKAPHKEQARPASPVFYNTPPTTNSGLQDSCPQRYSGAYVIRKSASTAGIRPSPSMSLPLENGHSVPRKRPPPGPWPPVQAVQQQQPCPRLAAHWQPVRDDMALHSTRNNAHYIPMSLATPVESPPYLRLSGPGRTDGEVHGDLCNHAAQREALRTPRSPSREADTPLSATPQQSPRHGPPSGSYVPATQQRVSYLLGRLQAQTQAAAATHNHNDRQPLPQPQQVPCSFSLDTYVYAQDASVCPLPPPPGIQVSSAADIADVANAASAAAALEASYAAAMAASERLTGGQHQKSQHQKSQQKKNTPTPSYVYACIDPRVHWTRARSKEWHADKQAEIKARGGRKANVGMAAQRTARQKQKLQATAAVSATSPTPAVVASGVPCAWEGRLPDSVLGNKAWTDLLGTFAHDEEKRLQKAQRLAQQYQQRYGS